MRRTGLADNVQDPNVEDNRISRQEYIRRVLAAYCKTPGTTGSSRRGDRLLAANLFEHSVPLIAIENALLLAAARRLFRPDDAPPLPTIRSLAYFSPVIDEVLHSHASQDYFLYLRRKLEPFAQTAPGRSTHHDR
jgi:hypothetical protein